MSTNEPPPEQPSAGQTPPPPAEPTPGQGYGAPPPAATSGVPRPGELLDRFLARLIDGVILGVSYGVLTGIFSGIFLQGIGHSSGELFVYWLFLSVVSTAVYLGYFGFLESSRGATLGKQLLKLKVVGPDGVSNPSLEQSIRRNIWLAFGLAGIVPVIGSLIGGVASLVAVIMIAVGINKDSVNRQAWHDRFAGGTRVLKIG